MVLRVDVVASALEEVFRRDPVKVKEDYPVILLTPQGRTFDQAEALSLCRQECLILLCGRYEGVDERVREHLAGVEISLGDFVLSGGEIAAAALLEAVVRLIPDAVGNVRSLEEESFTSGLLEYPQYTRPASYRDWEVPPVLLSGDHQEIERWRESRRVERTRERRPDLLGDGG